MRFAWLVALCGCDGVLHLETVGVPRDAPALDVARDAGTMYCADKQTALLCADFEGGFPPRFLADGVLYNLPAHPNDVTASQTASPDGVGLSIDSTGTQYSFGGAGTSSMTATMIDIEMLIRFDRVDTFTGEIPLVAIGVGQNNAGFGSCRVELQLNDAPKRLNMQDYCGTNQYPDIFTTFPAGWNKIGLVLDLPSAQASTFVNGARVAMLDLGANVSPGAAPFATIGLIGPGTAGVSFDDVVAVVTP